MIINIQNYYYFLSSIATGDFMMTLGYLHDMKDSILKELRCKNGKSFLYPPQKQAETQPAF